MESFSDPTDLLVNPLTTPADSKNSGAGKSSLTSSAEPKTSGAANSSESWMCDDEEIKYDKDGNPILPSHHEKKEKPASDKPKKRSNRGRPLTRFTFLRSCEVGNPKVRDLGKDKTEKAKLVQEFKLLVKGLKEREWCGLQPGATLTTQV